MPETNTLIEIRDLHTNFYLAEGVVRAVDGVNLTIKRGQTIGIVGESGCGKSITAFSILRLLPPAAKIEQGEILFYRPVKSDHPAGMVDEVNITKLDPGGSEIRSIRGNQISMVFQEPMTAMSPVRTVGQQIMEVIVLHQKLDKSAARAKTIDILARVRMPKPDRVVDDYPFQLSGGMRQRAVIAMALACRPSLLIADEPTTALDVTTEAQILDLMRSLQDDLDMAIMYITHNLGVVAEMAQEVAVMYLGKVVEHTDVKSIFYEPLHPYTRGLLSSIPRLDESIIHADRSKRLTAIKGMVPDPYARLKGCPFHPRCPQMIADVCDKVDPQDVQVNSNGSASNHMVRCHLYSDSKPQG